MRAWVGSGFSASAAAFSGANRRTEMVSFPPRTARHWGLCEGERVPHLPDVAPTLPAPRGKLGAAKGARPQAFSPRGAGICSRKISRALQHAPVATGISPALSPVFPRPLWHPLHGHLHHLFPVPSSQGKHPVLPPRARTCTCFLSPQSYLAGERGGGGGRQVGRVPTPLPAPLASSGVPRSTLGSRPQPLPTQLGSCRHRPLHLVFGPPCLGRGQGGGGIPKDGEKQGVAKKRRRPVPGLPALPYMAAAAPGQEVTTTVVSMRQRWRFGGPRLAWPLGGKIGGGLWSLLDPLAGKCHPAPAPTSPHPSPGDGCAGG